MANFFVDILSQVIAGVLTAGLLAAIAYKFRSKIINIFNKENVLPPSKIPDIKVEFEDVSSVYDVGKHMEGFNLTNEGEIAVSEIYMYSYCHSRKQTNQMIITPLNYKAEPINSSKDQGGVLRLEVDIKDRMNVDGVFIQLKDEEGIFFVINIYMILEQNSKNGDNYFFAEPQGIRRLKRKLPKKKLVEDKQILKEKYGIDIARG